MSMCVGEGGGVVVSYNTWVNLPFIELVVKIMCRCVCVCPWICVYKIGFHETLTVPPISIEHDGCVHRQSLECSLHV